MTFHSNFTNRNNINFRFYWLGLLQGSDCNCAFYVVCNIGLWIQRHTTNNNTPVSITIEKHISDAAAKMRSTLNTIAKHFTIENEQLDTITIRQHSIPTTLDQLQPVDHKSTPLFQENNSISYKSIEGFPFNLNVELDKVPSTVFYFFHHRSDADNKICQPPFNHHCINHGSNEFQKMFDDIQDDSFDDITWFHFAAYKVKETNSTEISQSRWITSIENDFSNSSHYSAYALNEEVFKKVLIPLVSYMSSNNIMMTENMKIVDKYFNTLSSDNKDGISDEVFFRGSGSYVPFFEDDKDKPKSRLESKEKETFFEFLKHVHSYMSLRLGTIEGIHRLFCVSFYFDHFLNQNDLQSSPSYIRDLHRCKITNLKQSLSEQEWNDQIEELRDYSLKYERNKSSNIKRSTVDMFVTLERKFVVRNQDFFPIYRKSNRRLQDIYFLKRIYPMIRNFIEYLTKEAHGYKKKIDEETLHNTIPFKNNEVIEACMEGYDFQKKSSALKLFWKKLKYDLSLRQIAASSFNIRTVRFANHFHNHITPTDSKTFINLFHIQETQSRSYLKQHYVVHCLRNLLIILRMCQYTRYTFLSKLNEIRQCENDEFYEKQLKSANLKSDKEEDSSPTRALDFRLIGKYIICI